jgi:hypothetical protein
VSWESDYYFVNTILLPVGTGYRVPIFPFPTILGTTIKERIKAGRMTGRRRGSVRRGKVRGVKVEGTKQREGNGGGYRTIGCTSRETQEC